MIRNFEEYTGTITDLEQTFIVPRVANLLILSIGKENAITNSSIQVDINVTNPIKIYDESKGSSYYLKTSGPRLRHIIHVLRVSDTIPLLVATSYGYYVSNDVEEINKYIASIEDRMRSIYDIRRALKRQLSNYLNNNVAVQQELIF